MRGLAVVVMISRTSWTPPDVTGPTRQSRPYFYFMVIAGMGAPLFLWLAGLAVPVCPTRACGAAGADWWAS